MKIKSQIPGFIPIFIAISFYIFITDQVYVWVQNDLNINIYNIAQAFSAILMGLLSDRFCRRKMVLITHALAIPLLFSVYFLPTSIFFVTLFGLLYNPLPIVRAALVDNLKNHSKLRLISFSFVMQFLPDIFYNWFPLIPSKLSFILSMGMLVLITAMIYFLFYDARDKIVMQNTKVRFIFQQFFHSELKHKALFTFFAFIPTQIVYFFSNNLLENYAEDPLYYSVLCFGFVVGASISMIYKKISHGSILTVIYGICLMNSIIPPVSIYIYKFGHISVPFQFVMFGCLIGFFISFVYDIILHAVEANFRGATCGIIDFVYLSASLISLTVYKLFKIDPLIIFILIPICFLLSLVLQKVSEKHQSHKQSSS